MTPSRALGALCVGGVAALFSFAAGWVAAGASSPEIHACAS
jgi:hypothetical protein